MERFHLEKKMKDLVEELENNSAYLLDHFFSNRKPGSVDVKIHIRGTVFVIPDIWDISAFEYDPSYLFFIPSRFVSPKSILNTNISDMVQLYALPQDQIKLTFIQKNEPYRHELEIKIDNLSPN